jgi:hypothetical protein
VRPSIFHLAMTGIFVWGFSASSACEAHCAQATAGLPSAQVRGSDTSTPRDGCEHGSPREHAPRGHGNESGCSGGVLSVWCTAIQGASLQARVADARDGGVLRLLALAPHPAPASLAAVPSRSIPPGAAPVTAARRQHRNPPLLI